MFKFIPGLKVHFIGIGGIGMSGIAEVLLSFGLTVTGSDLNTSDNSEKLKSLGAKVFLGHQSQNVTDQSIVVYSSAVKFDNPEMIKAKELNIPIMKRAEMLGEIMRLKLGLAVAGTHGKTTTTSFLATLFEEAGLDPTYVIGGIPKNLQKHAKVGKGEVLIAESDESDGSFLLLNPIMSVITNIDNDHLDYYGTEEKLVQAYLDFANRVPFYGLCSLNAHDQKLMELKKKIKRPSITFGIRDLGIHADLEARNLVPGKNDNSYELYFKDKFLTKIRINIPGVHNVLNSLAAISLAYFMGVPVEKMAHAMEKFEGVGRRFQQLYDKNFLEIIDDYGHHPTEIQKTLETAKKTRSDRKIICIFEPHRFTRTRDCWNAFLHCFNSSDELYLCPIYPASEKPIDEITSDRLAADINRLHPKLVKNLNNLDEIKKIVQYNYDVKTTLVVMGAGPIGKKIHQIVETM